MVDFRGREIGGGQNENILDRIQRDEDDRRRDKFGGRVPSAGDFAPGGSLGPAPVGRGTIGDFVGQERNLPGGSNPASGVPEGGGYLAQLMAQFNNPDLNASGAPEIFQPGLIPFSGSQSSGESTSIGGSTSSGESTSVGGSTSEGMSSSGIDFSNPFIGGITEQLSQYAANLPQNIEAGTEEAKLMAQMSGNKMLEGNLTTTLNSLANRGILGSSESERILKGVGTNAVEGQRMAGLQAGLDQAGRSMQAPNILTQMAQLGQGSRSTQGSQSVQGSASTQGSQSLQGSTSTQGSQSLQADPLAPYRLAGDFIASQT